MILVTAIEGIVIFLGSIYGLFSLVLFGALVVSAAYGELAGGLELIPLIPVISILWGPLIITAQLYDWITESSPSSNGNGHTQPNEYSETIYCKECDTKVGEQWHPDAKAFCSDECRILFDYRREIVNRFEEKYI